MHYYVMLLYSMNFWLIKCLYVYKCNVRVSYLSLIWSLIVQCLFKLVDCMVSITN